VIASVAAGVSAAPVPEAATEEMEGRPPLADQPAPSTPDSALMADRLKACTACHGDQGRSTNTGYFPRLAGKPAGYLLNQLISFRDGRRHNTAMAFLLRNLDDDYLKDIANWFAEREVPYPPPPPATLSGAQATAAQRLVTRGDTERALPACISCHGDQMTGARPGIPGLIGLPADYLGAQLGAWQTGQRRAQPPDCMHEVANKLTTVEIGALAQWLAARPLPADMHPAATAPHSLPLNCGGAK